MPIEVWRGYRHPDVIPPEESFEFVSRQGKFIWLVSTEQGALRRFNKQHPEKDKKLRPGKTFFTNCNEMVQVVRRKK